MLLGMSSQRLEVVEHLAGYIAFEASDGLGFGQSVLAAPFNVVARLRGLTPAV